MLGCVQNFERIVSEVAKDYQPNSVRPIRRMPRSHGTKGEKDRKSETKSPKSQNANTVCVLSPVEEVCLKFQPADNGRLSVPVAAYKKPLLFLYQSGTSREGENLATTRLSG